MKNRTFLKNFLNLFKPYKKVFILIIVLSVIRQFLNLVHPWLARIVMDKVIANKAGLDVAERLNILVRIGSGMLVIAVGFGVILFVRGTIMGKLMWRVIFDLRQHLNWHLQKLSLSFFSKQQTGRLVSRIINDINQIYGLVTQGIIRTFTDVLLLGFVIYLLIKISPVLTCLTFIILPVYVIAFRKLNPRIRKISKDVQKHVAMMSGNVQERLSGIALIKSFTSEEEEHRQFTEDNEALVQKALYRRSLNLSLRSITHTINLLSNGIILTAGGYLAITNKLSPGDVLAFILYVAQVYAPLNHLAEINISFQQAMGSLERVFELLHLTPDIKDAPDTIKKIEGNGHLKFNDVTFCYERDKPVLSDINLDIKPGSKLALIGASGAGKSTLASLVPRLYDVTKGSVLIDSFDIRKISLKTLRQTIGIVQQEPFLFSTTIRENIAYGRHDAPEDTIIEAAKTANADEFISELSDKYDSLVGERGVNLSVGQKQRICLARTILKDPKILILDEATSSLDSESENLVQKAMEKLMQGRTSIIIAHRLSTIMSADEVIVLDKGRIVEQGTHSELWQKGQYYTNILKQQFGPIKDLMDKSQG
jgi:subfamily B ATP-binding cassette protein MsbA